MNKKLLLAGSLRVMTRYKMRTFLMSVGVAVGVATLVATRSLGMGAEQMMLDKVERMFGPSSILIRAGGVSTGSGKGPGSSSGVSSLTLADLEAIDARLDEVVVWDPMIVLGGREVKYRDTSRQVTISGHSERAETVWHRGVVEGRFFTADDLDSAARVALVGTRIAEALFAGESPIGQQILIDSVPFRVKGVLEPIGIDPHGMDRDEDVHVPTTTAMRRLLNVDYIAMAKILVRDPEAVEETADQIAGILRQRHHIAEGEPSDFTIFTPEFVSRMIERASRVLKVFLPAAACLVLLVAAIVISSIMLIAVRERVAEVGLRKAVGATEGQISFQFLIEAVGITLASGIVGLLLGAGTVAVVGMKMQLPTLITAESIVLGLGAAIAVGIVSGLVPARRAARLDAVEALR